MKKICLIIILALFAVACSSTKKTSKQNNVSIDGLSFEMSPNRNPLSFQKEKQQKLDGLFIDATKFYITEDFQKAVDLYMQVLQLDPNNAAACYQIASAHITLNRITDAEIFASKAARLQPKNVDYLYKYAVLLVANGKIAQSLKFLDQIVDLKPSNDALYYNIIGIYKQLNKPKDMIRIYNVLEEIYGISEENSLAKFNLYLLLNDKESARKDIQKLQTTTSPDEAKYWEYELNYYVIDKDTNVFLNVLKNFETIIPNDIKTDEMKLYYYLTFHKNDEITKKLAFKIIGYPIVEFERKINTVHIMLPQMDNDPVSTYNNLVLAVCDTLQKMYPNEYVANKMLADYYHEILKNTAVAATYYEKTLAIDMSNYGDWTALVQCYWSDTAWSKMKETCLRALEVFPMYSLYFYFLGVAEFGNKAYPDAINALENAFALVIPEEVQLQKLLLGFLGDVYAKINNYNKAFEVYDQLLILDPENVGVLNNYAYYLSLLKKNLDKAAKMSLKTVQKEPTNPIYLDSYAWILFEQGKYETALDMMEMAIKYMDSPSAVYFEHYGDILWKNGYEKDAAAYWQEAQKIRTNEDDLSPRLEEKAIKGIYVK
ncbi:MAG: tetratricopeptide repeat protein [Bacteroidales bacterium]|jgi:tetratricopeptide (TPR) repeat protein|nr:tetratricopeptide repeat protein [Bacteroidales bacterium]